MMFFSIIIPVYNVKDWLSRCLDSILSDSCGDMELILVDDGSTDGSSEICDWYASSYSNIRVIHKVNGGLSSARNAGLEQASGEWISFIDSDDWVDRDTFLSIKSLLNQMGTKPDLLKFGYKKIFNDVTRDYIPCIPEGKYGREDIISDFLPVAFGSGRISDSTVNSFILSSCAHIYRHDFLNRTDVRFVSEREIGSEDFLFLFSLYMKASCVYVTHSTWYNYDTREGSLTRRYRKDLFTQYKALCSMIARELENEKLDKQLAYDFKVFYIGMMYICVMNECTSSETRIKQVSKVRKILKDHALKSYLRHLGLHDSKSRVITGFMRMGSALPLCIIQWKKEGKIL